MRKSLISDKRQLYISVVAVVANHSPLRGLGYHNKGCTLRIEHRKGRNMKG